MLFHILLFLWISLNSYIFFNQCFCRKTIDRSLFHYSNLRIIVLLSYFKIEMPSVDYHKLKHVSVHFSTALFRERLIISTLAAAGLNCRNRGISSICHLLFSRAQCISPCLFVYRLWCQLYMCLLRPGRFRNSKG